MPFTSEESLYKYFENKIIPQLLKHLALKVEQILKKNLSYADISTDTLQHYVTHSNIERQGNKYVCDVYINEELAQKQTQGTKIWDSPSGIRYVKFISLNGDTSYGGKSIVWNMINWLENTGANGNLGNNPIKNIGMFEKTSSEVESNLDKWVNSFLKNYKY